MYQSSMLIEVKEGLERARGEWRKICLELGIDYSWLCKVAQGQIDDPGVSRVERLHRYLVAVYPPEAA